MQAEQLRQLNLLTCSAADALVFLEAEGFPLRACLFATGLKLALALTLLSVHADRPAVSPTWLAVLTVLRAENAVGCEALPVKMNWFGSAAADTEEETEA